MAAKIDLTFQELATALQGMGIANAITRDATTGQVMVNASAIIGETATDMNGTGVSELVYKLRMACGNAQDTANANLNPGERLAAFPAFSYSPPANGKVQVTQISSFQIPLSDSTVIGTTA